MPTISKIDTNSKITYLTKLFQMFKKTNKHAIKIPKIINIHEKSHQDMTQTVIQICCVTFPIKITPDASRAIRYPITYTKNTRTAEYVYS